MAVMVSVVMVTVMVVMMVVLVVARMLKRDFMFLFFVAVIFVPSKAD